MEIMLDGGKFHPSTRLSLEALQWLEDRIAPQNVLDMGCGSGILSLIAAQLWDAKVLACDISEKAIEDTTGNINEFGMEEAITAIRSDGFKHGDIQKHGPFGLIIINLLAQWHVAMAMDIHKELLPGGRALLSGILAWQMDGIRDAFGAINMHIEQIFTENEWQAAVLVK